MTSIFPAGLAAGQAQTTIVTFDLETGYLSNESNTANFQITVGSLRHINEDEPNDSVETATDLTYPIIVDGSAAVNDPADLMIQFNDGRSEKLHDLFYLPWDKDASVTVSLGFLPTGDLDLFLLQENADGNLVVVASSAHTQTILEQLTGTLKAGNYYIAVGAFSGGSGYLLTVTQNASLTDSGSLMSVGERQPMLVERKIGQRE